jgi:transcriptional regulator with XRE-family HTH domain
MERGTTGFGREHLRSLGRRLRHLRETRSWSLKRLSAESDISIAAIQKIESGGANPSLVTVLAIAEVLGEPVDRLIAASRKASRTVNVVRGVLPVGMTGAISLEPRLTRPRMYGQVITIPARNRMDAKDTPTSGAVFAYVLDGVLRLSFADGQCEQLATGDSIHVIGELPVEWSNPVQRRSLVLCLADRKSEADQPSRKDIR